MTIKRKLLRKILHADVKDKKLHFGQRCNKR